MVKVKMKRLFKKDENKKTISEPERAELAKRIYELGFEVGYHKHSELGWVTERRSKLDAFAREYGLDEFIRSYYIEGKENGARSKERDMHAGLSGKVGEKEVEQVHVPSARVSFGEKPEEDFENSFKRRDTTDERTYAPVKQPTMIDLPDVTLVTKAIDRPTLLKGFKALMPKT